MTIREATLGVRCKGLCSAQSRPTLCDPMDCSPPGTPVPGTLQARTLEWAALPSSRGSSPPRHRTWVRKDCKQGTGLGKRKEGS